MDYNLQKWLEPSFYSPFKNFISPYPSTDFVNPGIGGAVKIFNAYEPIHTISGTHSIEKKLDPSLLQEGTGETEPDLNKEYVKCCLTKEPLR
jgi:hypothetical protein